MYFGGCPTAIDFVPTSSPRTVCRFHWTWWWQWGQGWGRLLGGTRYLLNRARAPHGHRLPSECGCSLRGLCCNHKVPKAEVPTTWNLWIHHWEIAKHSIHAKHVLDIGDTVVKRTVLSSWPLCHMDWNITLVFAQSYLPEKTESYYIWLSLLGSRDSLSWPRKHCLGKTYSLEADFFSATFRCLLLMSSVRKEKRQRDFIEKLFWRWAHISVGCAYKQVC